MKCFLTVVIWVLLGQFATAHTLDDAALQGTVYGYSGNDTTILVGAWVRVTNLSAGQTDSVQTDGDGDWTYTFHISGVPHASPMLPQTIDLAPNYPNPFSNVTTFSLTNPIQQDVQVSIYNILGQKVTELVNKKLQPGYYNFQWNGRNAEGHCIAGGIYFAVVHAPSGVKSRKIVLLDPGNGSSGGGNMHIPMMRTNPTGSEVPAQRAGEFRTLDDISVLLEFMHPEYNSMAASFMLADGQDSVLTTYLRHRNSPPPGMVLVPAGSFTVGSNLFGESQPMHTVTVPAFYIDVFEVTNAQYRAFCDSTNRDYPADTAFASLPNYFTDPLYATYPVVLVSWRDARDYAAWIGKRLPTEAEWELAAKGSLDNRQYPWGNTWNASNANSGASDGYTYTSPVGSFPGGISPVGCHDMAGNVWEYCEDDWHINYTGAPVNGQAWIDSMRGLERTVRGGCWSSASSYVGCAYRQNSAWNAPTNKKGFRCARSAVNQSPGAPCFPSPAHSAVHQMPEADLFWSCSDPDLDRLTFDVYFGSSSPLPLVSIGQTADYYNPGTLDDTTIYYWRIEARDNHSNLTIGPTWMFSTAGSDTENMVLVPASSYQMGAVYQNAALPIHSVNVPTFYMDVYEVTNAQYRSFCYATGRADPPESPLSWIMDYYTNSAYANFPVVMVSWQDAHDYAVWAGKRLPTEAEWELAAKGALDNRPYPWGATWIAANANIYNNPPDGYPYTAPVGTYPNGISPAGCYDMAGNVMEWCEDDWHTTYSGSPANGSAWINNPRASDRVTRSGSWYHADYAARCAYRNHYGTTTGYHDQGFRCAKTP